MGGFFNKDFTFYTKNLFFTTKDAQSFVKICFFSNMFTFLSVIRQNFEYNLRILANFSVKTQKSMDFAHAFENFTVFFRFFNKDYPFYTKNLFFFNKRCPKFVKISFFSNMFTFLGVISQNFEYSLRILANFRVKAKKSMDFARTF